MAPQPEAEDYREFMTDTGESLDRIIQTVEGLLSLAELEAASVNEAVELRSLSDQVLRELSGWAGKKQVSLAISGQAELRGNANLLYRAVFNLVENAIKYNHFGGSVHVNLEQTDAAVHIQVEDTGSGMEEGILTHIFEPFYRADSSRSHQISGSGLGLSVVKLIVERHGGQIQVISRPGEGTVFDIQLKR